jgi:hypothetical protein
MVNSNTVNLKPNMVRRNPNMEIKVVRLLTSNHTMPSAVTSRLIRHMTIKVNTPVNPANNKIAAWLEVQLPAVFLAVLVAKSAAMVVGREPL